MESFNMEKFGVTPISTEEMRETTGGLILIGSFIKVFKWVAEQVVDFTTGLADGFVDGYNLMTK